MRQQVHQKVFFISCILVSFFLPVFPKFIPVVIALMFLNWIISGIYLSTVPRLFSEKWRIRTLSFSALYLFYAAGMLYTTNYTYGWFDLEVKLSLLIFPVIFATSDLEILTRAGRKPVIEVFVAGCIAGSLLFLGHTIFVNVQAGVRDSFYYTNLSWYFHPSYLAMYCVFGFNIVMISLFRDFSRLSPVRRAGLFLVILYLEGFIFLLSSKAGLALLVITGVLFVALMGYKKTGLKRVILVSTLMVTVFVAFALVFPFAFSRVADTKSVVSPSTTVQTNFENGSVARVALWKVSLKQIRENFLFGTGTGDVQDAFLNACLQGKLMVVYSKKLNSHNQYFQTFITLGVFGFGLLVALLLIPAWQSFRKRNYLYFIFLVIFLINMLVESMLETQAGVVFYAFFNVLLFSGGGVVSSKDRLQPEEQDAALLTL